ncbi:hypothetical protein D9757_012561 [Collybiopsis confluens]|uniref:Uncharacterized protein n=1 Tax=Collybiopsis confluens TaxID=2823264 RepID=A0A8H5G192_9AGAR|nr:hypothetical protein D9757_012561 [Collybiopsis confluens]
MLKTGHGLFVMNPWHWDELRRYGSRHPRDAQCPRPPTPRALASYLPDVLEQNNRFNPDTSPVSIEMHNAVAAIASAKDLARHLSTTAKHAKILMIKKIPKLRLDELHASYHFWYRGPGAAGTKFELLFLRALCDSTKDQYVKFGDIYGAELRPTSMKLTPPKLKPRATDVDAGKSDNDSDDDVDVPGAPKMEKNEQRMSYEVMNSCSHKIFTIHRTGRDFTNHAHAATPGILWIPRFSNNPIFGAVTVELGGGPYGATVWVIQLTSAKPHSGSQTGTEKVLSIHNHIQDQIREAQPKAKVDLAWLLVVPYRRQDSYSWSLYSIDCLARKRVPPEGRVFVQAFDSKQNL